MINGVTVLDGGPIIRDEDVAMALTDVLGVHFGDQPAITSLERRLAAYHSSFRLEEIDVQLAGGTTLELMFKDLSRPLEQAQRVKPAFLFDPQREIDTYRTILGDARFGTPICYGTIASPVDGQYWLFIERIVGTRLRELGDFPLWELAARWLATLHGEYAAAADQLEEEPHLLKYDRDHFAIWIERALQVAADDAPTRRSLEWLADRYEPVIDRLALMPKTLIHGEFYPSNVLVRETESTATVCPVDWEMAAVGPGLIDLAALTSGWAEPEVDRLVRAYYTTANGSLDPAMRNTADFAEAFDCCRLHLAVQWLGWASGWQPPPEHTHDWLKTALGLAERLGL